MQWNWLHWSDSIIISTLLFRPISVIPVLRENSALLLDTFEYPCKAYCTNLHGRRCESSSHFKQFACTNPSRFHSTIVSNFLDFSNLMTLFTKSNKNCVLFEDEDERKTKEITNKTQINSLQVKINCSFFVAMYCWNIENWKFSIKMYTHMNFQKKTHHF